VLAPLAERATQRAIGLVLGRDILNGHGWTFFVLVIFISYGAHGLRAFRLLGVQRLYRLESTYFGGSTW
jgi:hypothetical protein